MIRSCKGCTERYIGCHDHCDNYLKEKQAANEARAKQQEEKMIDNTYVRLAIERNKIWHK